ncbi:MAG: FapA family protein [Phycisphaeraceae bacterium]|nr:FapA family protein [Phycisphaeraceae bacterium]
MDENSEPKIDIAKNKMSATLIVPESYDRSSLTPQVCMVLLQRAEIDTQAIDQDILENYIAEANAAGPGQFEGLIANATPPEHGTDARLEWLVGGPTDQTNPPAEGADDNTDDTAEQASDGDAVCFYSHSVYNVVRSGDVLGEFHPETPGTDGRDVLGKTIAARQGKPLGTKLDESIQIKDGKELLAQCDGVLIQDEASARISDTLEVENNVDFSTGNIDFPGNVLVLQGVKDGFTIKAHEDIEIRGLIEAASLIAGKDLHLKGGFAGREQGEAEVAGNLYGKYLDAVTARITGDLCVEREVINSNCTVLGNIDSPRGSLIGGCTRVSGTIKLSELGAPAQPVTELHIGVLPVLDPLIDELSGFVQQCIDERDELLGEQEMITANSGARIAPSHQEKLDGIMLKMGRLQLQLDRAEPSLERIRERAESIRQIDVLVDRKVHPNAMLVCGEYRYRVMNEIKGPARITANKRGQLEYRQGSGQSRLLSEEAELKIAA